MIEDKPITEEEVAKAVRIIEHIRLRNHLHDPDRCSGCEEAERSLDLYPRLIADWRKLRAELVVIPAPNEAAGCIPCFTCGGFRLPGKSCSACAGARARVKELEAQAKEDEAKIAYDRKPAMSKPETLVELRKRLDGYHERFMVRLNEQTYRAGMGQFEYQMGKEWPRISAALSEVEMALSVEQLRFNVLDVIASTAHLTGLVASPAVEVLVEKLVERLAAHKREGGENG